MAELRPQGTRSQGVGVRRAVQGERRIVTVLFSDVAGSTSMAEQLDPEEWAEIMNEAFQYLTAPIDRYGGMVARLMGDSILAFFGAPVAHEDDPQRAVLAALDIVNGIRPFADEIKREYSLDFNVRVGINTGPAVVGDVGNEVGGEYTAMGDAVNVAARMEQTAQPGAIQISGDTHRLVAPLFDFEDLGGIKVKGKAEPVSTFGVLRAKSQPGRLRGIEGLAAPLAGRSQELGQLMTALQDVRQGRGQIVSLVGEAGLGKSRLLEETKAEWEKDGAGGTWQESHGVSYDTARPYGQFQQRVRQLYGIDEGDSPEAVQQIIETAPEGFSEDLHSLVCRSMELLLAVRADTGQPQLEGEALKREAFQAVTEIWRHQASQAPAVMVFDDLHWADSASVELLQHLFQLTEETPILILCAFRPERRSPAWQVKQVAEMDYPHCYTEIVLAPLSPEDSDSLVSGLLTVADLPAELRRLILEKADGNPFFVEEIVRTLIEGGDVVRDGSGDHWRATRRVDDIAIPDNLQSMLVSRFDRLEEEVRRTLQLASVIGRSFYYKVLEVVSDAADALDKQLGTLQRFELIREAARVPELEYAFRHELTREAAYSSILRRQSRRFHRQVGEAMETLFPDRLEEHAHRLAHHFNEANDNQRAMDYYTMAGDAAARIYANTEAITHYTRALELAKANSAANDRLIRLYTSLGGALRLDAQFDEAIAIYKELETTGLERGDKSLELAALIPQATVHSTFTAKFDPDQGEALATRALEISRNIGEPAAEAKALWNLLLVNTFGEGSAERAVDFGEQSVAIAREHDLREELAFTLNDIARCYFAVGRKDEAWASLSEARSLWRELENLPMLTDNLSSGSMGHFLAGDLEEAMRLSNESLQVSESIRNIWGMAAANFSLSIMDFEQGKLSSSIGQISEAIGLADEAGFIGMPVAAEALLGWIYGYSGDFDAGFSRVDHALSMSDPSQEFHPFVIAVKAHLLMSAGDLDQAGEVLKETESALVSDYGGMMELLHRYIEAEVGLARGKYDEVRELLSRTLEEMEKVGLRYMIGDMHRIDGQALLELGRTAEARDILVIARAEAEEQGSERGLWPALFLLAQTEAALGNHGAAETLRERAAAIIDNIAATAESIGLRDSFMNTAPVKAVLDSSYA